MKRTVQVLATMVALATIIGCGFGQPTAAPISPSAAAQPVEDTPEEAVVMAPSATVWSSATPRPSPTLVPTVTRRPTQPAAQPEPASTPRPELVATMEALEMEVAAFRGLDETTPITRSLLSRGELTAYLEQQFQEDYTAEEIEVGVRVLVAFDFVEQGYDLRQVLLDIYAAEVLGIYEDDVDSLYVVTEEEFSLLDRLTFVHEYVHGLQDQHFDLEAFVDEDRLSDDEALARMALIEGDATQAMSQYLLLHMADINQEDIKALSEGAESDDGAALAAAPSIIRETVLFPYTYGLEFVLVLFEDGWEAVNAAFADPPRSTEQILHPQKYLDGDEPRLVALPPLTDTLGIGWTLVESEVLGEFQTGLYLAQQVDQDTVAQASEGWGGDRYAVYTKDEAEVLVFASVWDTEADREEFVDAYRQYAEAKYRGVGHGTAAAQLWWEIPGEATLLTWKGDRAVVLVGPDAPTVQKVLVPLDHQ
jgi:hypothetical protein